MNFSSQRLVYCFSFPDDIRWCWKVLNMDIDIFGMLSGDIKDIISASYDKNDIVEELVWASRDILPVVRLAPRYLKWFLKDFSKKIISFTSKIPDTNVI